MALAYCMVCRSWMDERDMVYTFRTGFVRVAGVDHPLGVCGKRDEPHLRVVSPMLTRREDRSLSPNAVRTDTWTGT
ncbi:hypothetical protein [Alicyclobacillus macrosporangiidus]|uniref:DUF3973 domain-containing protein n=1 Tax=Alicyclobacillus macrosporangiidus TaxID=392015 RepID=A0A1I7IZ65_9BACL|nr:hypothetical protein [Alicyclobacillus macrosporangiidus]SFU78239.1 hypothetical protein SAMN05421543_10810 [Alicyclobacillus macrosporangiidus]